MWYGLGYALGTLRRCTARPAAFLLRWRRRPGAVEERACSTDNHALADAPTQFSRSCIFGAALALAVETGRPVFNRPSVNVSLEPALLELVGDARDEPQPDGAACESADIIASILQEHEMTPKRVGVDGVPGSMRSALSRALADRLDMEWRSLDRENMDVPREFTEQRTIYEHHRLFRTQNVDVFDVIIYVDEAMEVSQARAFQRAREEARQCVITDVLNYNKLKLIGRLAFAVCEGEAISVPECRSLMKIRPPAGFRAVEHIRRGLRDAGHDGEGRSKEEMLLLLTYGTARRGLTAYIMPSALNEQLIKDLLAEMRSCLTR